MQLASTPVSGRFNLSYAFWLVLLGTTLATNLYAGPELQLHIVAVVPVVLLAWEKGFFFAASVGVVASLLRFSFHFAWDFPIPPQIALTNCIVRCIVLVVVAAIVAQSARHYDALRERLQALETQVLSGDLAGKNVESAQFRSADEGFNELEWAGLEIPLSKLDRCRLAAQRWVRSRPELVWLMPLKLQRGKEGRRELRLRELCLKNYDLLVDAYPRSANSFLAMAFKVAAPRLRVRRHAHQPTHVIKAGRDGKPVCVIVRPPLDAVASAVVHFRWPLQYALARYRDYYSALLPYLGRIQIVTFQEATTELPEVFSALNRRFAVGLPAPLIDECFLAAVGAEVRALDCGRDPIWVSLPSMARAPQLQEVKRRLRAERYAMLLGESETLFERIVGSRAGVSEKGR